MWSENKKIAGKKVRLANGSEMIVEERAQGHKLSTIMAMILGAFLTAEIMVASAMIFDFNLYYADKLSVVFAFVVLYMGVVAMLTDR
ncbi:MAG: hypothetical protein Q4B47_05860 [Eubacteriales bacterium]|nr:hypothetical protein [Eubacteriales bacterium]